MGTRGESIDRIKWFKTRGRKKIPLCLKFKAMGNFGRRTKLLRQFIIAFNTSSRRKKNREKTETKLPVKHKTSAETKSAQKSERKIRETQKDEAGGLKVFTSDKQLISI